jgi:hypothetical protein
MKRSASHSKSFVISTGKWLWHDEAGGRWRVGDINKTPSWVTRCRSTTTWRRSSKPRSSWSSTCPSVKLSSIRALHWSLAHDLIREAALRQLPQSERRRIQRQAAAWLEGEAGDDVRLLRLAL